MSSPFLLRSPRARIAGIPLLIAALAGASLVAAPSASAATVNVATPSQVMSALAISCADGDTVRLTADIVVPDAELPIACSVRLDLNGFDLTASNVYIVAGRTFTVADTSTTDVLQTGVFLPTGGEGRPGLQTTGATLALEGGRIRAVGGRQAAGVGGASGPLRGSAAAHAGTLIMTGGGLVATGGSASGGGSGPSGAGLGGGYEGSGGTITVTGGVVSVQGGNSGAGIGGGYRGAAGTITIGGTAVVQDTSGGSGGSGIGSGQEGGTSGSVGISGSARVTVSAGAGAAGIGGGANSSGPAITISGSATVDATGVNTGAGIGAGNRANATSVTITGGTVTARGGDTPGPTGITNGEGGAGIGGGRSGNAGIVTISGTADVTAIGGRLAAGIGGGRVGGGGTISIEPSALVRTSGGTNIGPAPEASTGFGSTTVSGTLVLSPPPPFGDGGVKVLDSEPGAEITVGATGIIRGSQVAVDGTGTFGPGASIYGAGQIQNNGAITLTAGSVGVAVKGNHYRVTFDTRGGSAAPDPVTVFASSFQNGGRAFPPDPTRPGRVFLGWNTAADGTGTTVTSTSTLPGSSADGTAVPITAFALWDTPATIDGAATASGNVGSAFSYTPTLSGLPRPTVSSTALPDGLSLNTTTGAITGTPTTVGQTQVTLTATNTYGSDTQPVSITVGPQLVAASIDGATTASGNVGSAFSYTPTVSGFPAPMVTSTALPDGLSLDSATGAITGTPTATGQTEVTLTATNSQGSDTQAVTITIAPRLVAASIDGATTASGNVGSAFSYTPTVSGFPAPVVTSTALPDGLSLDPTTGAITGTPTATGQTEVTLTATNSQGTDTQTVSITVGPQLVAASIDGAATASGNVGSAFSYTPSVSGFPAPVVTSTPLPAGLSLDAGTGAITGTPTATGQTEVTLTATNSTGTDTQTVVISVGPRLVAASIEGAATASGNVGVAFRYAPTVVGFPAPEITSTTLPDGLSLDAATGEITGTPTTTGQSDVTLTAVNSQGTDTLTVSITIGPATTVPTIEGAATASGTVGSAFTYTPTVTGLPAPAVSSTALPAGLSLDPGTGAITGTPTASGTTQVTLTATNTEGSDSLTVQVSIAGPPVDASIPTAVNGRRLAGSLRAAIGRLKVRGETVPGFASAAFIRWDDVDGDCRDTAAEVLQRDSTRPVRGTCTVTSGRWVSRYDGRTARSPRRLVVAPAVPFQEVWESGARAWTPDRREAFANDLAEPKALVVTSTRSANARAAKEPGRWMPSVAGCTYVADWVAIKLRWGLTVDRAEKRALARLARGCAGTRVVTTLATVVRVTPPAS